MSRVRSYIVVVFTLAAVTAGMVALRDDLGLATVALVYLLVVFLASAWSGRTVSVLASVLAFLTMNFFFTIPYHTFFVAATRDVLSLLVFLVVAVMTNQLVTRLRQSEAVARRQAWEASTLHALSQAVTTAGWSAQVLGAITSRVVEILRAEECAIFLEDAAGALRVGGVTPGPTASSMVEAAARGAFGGSVQRDEGDALALPLQVGERRVGVLALRGEDLPGGTAALLRTFAAQLALVIEQSRLQREAAGAEALRQADELKSALLSAVSHDLRTPLSAIRTAATGLADGEHWTDESRRELLEMIDAEAARLSRLVGNLLDMTRIEAGALHPRKEWHDVSEVVARAVDHLKNRPSAHRVVIDVPEDLPLVLLDFTQIEDVLINLLDNSIRHAPGGTDITITARAERSHIRVVVANDGPPIPADAAVEIFTRFYSTAGQRHGHGLGLAICKGLVEAHGGRIWVERPAEPGARFAFTLPLPEAGMPAVMEGARSAVP